VRPRCRRVVRGGLAGVEQVIAATACKGRAAFGDGAAAVDMESHIAAAYAAEAGLPFGCAAGHLRSRQPGASGAGQERHQPNGDIDSASAARGAAIRPRLRAWSPRDGFQSALRSLRGWPLASCTAKRGSATADYLIRAGFLTFR